MRGVGEGAGHNTTIHYSDGVDTYVAESDETSATGWAWQNLTKVFDGVTDGGVYYRVNLASNRDTGGAILWATAIFKDSSTSKIWVKTKRETVAQTITAWNAAIDVSDVNNTTTIFGQSGRSIGETGPEKKDMIYGWKTGTTLYSRFWDNASFEVIQTIDASVWPSTTHAKFDFEHTIILGIKHIHVIYVDGNGSISFRHRGVGDTDTWEAADVLCTTTSGHGAVGIVEHGDGLSYIFWKESNGIEWRILDENGGAFWSPILANSAYQFDPATEAIVKTTSIMQMQTADQVPAAKALISCWIGEIGILSCERGWGVIVESSSSSSESSSSESSSSSSDSG